MSESTSQSKKRKGPFQKSLLEMGFGKHGKAETNSSTLLPEAKKPHSDPGVGGATFEQICNLSVSSSSSNFKFSDPDVDSKMDIAFYKSLTKLDAEQKFSVLTKLSRPEINYRFPVTKFGSQNRAFQAKHLDEFSWLAYSLSTDAAFCKPCFAFAKESVGNGLHQSPSILTSKGFNGWNKSKDYFKAHASNLYHVEACEFAENFVKIYTGKSTSIVDKITSQHAKQKEANRKALGRIIEIIKFCGKQNISLRGHDDQGRISIENPDKNDGNFRALVRFLAQSGDQTLLTHLESAPSNAMYSSPKIQNQIIKILGNIIQKRIVVRVNSAKYFSIMADETTDISNVEQLTLCVRYLYNNNVEEDFLSFVPVTNLTGEGLADTILTTLKDMGIDLSGLRGQTYDGAAAMSGCVKGVKTRILEKYPNAMYTYCASHCLNLVISDACSTPSIRNMIGTLKEICNFFARSALRSSHLKRFIEESGSKRKYKGLISPCETRWVERHDAIVRFVTILPSVVQTLEYLEKESRDSETRTKAHCLLKATLSFDFIISLYCATKLFALSLPLSKSLQTKNIDLKFCYEKITELSATIAYMKENLGSVFKEIYDKAVEVAQSLDVEVKMPRICKRQNYRQNIPANSSEEYYRLNIFTKFLGEFWDSLSSRFEDHSSSICELLNIMPIYAKNASSNDIKKMYNLYKSDLACEFEIFDGEFTLWRNKWKKAKVENIPRSAQETLVEIGNDYLPNISKLVKIFCTLPITTATAERTFSTLRRVKSYLRNTMSEDRLVGLALLHTYYNEDIASDEVIDEFKKSERKMML